MARVTLTERAHLQGKEPIDLILPALEKAGSVNGAAKMLGIRPRAIYHHLEAHGLKAVTTTKRFVTVVQAEAN